MTLPALRWDHPDPAFLDFETVSACDLKAVGGRRYAADPTTRILSLVLSRGPVTHLWIPGLPPDWSPNEIVTKQLAEGGWVKSDTRPTWFTNSDEQGLYILAGSDTITKGVIYCLASGVPLVAHNAMGFDRHIWDRFFGPHPWGWADSLYAARAAGFPGKLDLISKAAGSGGKDAAAKLVMKLTKATVTPTGVMYPVVGPGVVGMLARYNLRDVSLIRELWDGPLAATGIESDVLEAHVTVNERGVALDVPLVQAIRDVAGVSAARAGDAIAAIAGPNPDGSALNWKSVPQLRAWLATKGVRVLGYDGKETLRKEAVERCLTNPDLMWDADSPVAATGAVDPAVVEVLKLRAAATRITGAKAQRAEARVCPDGRVRDLFAYHQAHTGRWSSSGIQVHNLPRAKKGAMTAELLADFAVTGWGKGGAGWPVAGYDRVKTLLGDSPASVDDAMGALLRPAFVAAPGHALLICDYAAVEARGIAWVAGQQDLLDTFAAGEDVYLSFGARLFGRPITKADATERQIAKVTVLGCIAEDTPVLTDAGWVPIQHVASHHQVWDGESYVSHDGVIDKGVRDCILVEGVHLTSDHEVLTSQGWLPACQASTATLPPGRYSESGRFILSPTVPGAGSPPSPAAARVGMSAPSTWKTSCTGGQPGVTPAPGSRPTGPGVSTPTSFHTPGTANDYSTASAPYGVGVSAHRARNTRCTAGGESPSIPPGSPTAASSFGISQPCRGGTTPGSKSTGSTTTGGMSRGISDSPLVPNRTATGKTTHESNTTGGHLPSPSSPASTCRNTGRLLPSIDCSRAVILPHLSSVAGTTKRVFDIVNAGPNHRFQAGRLIVHNCGYGLGAEKFALYCAGQGVNLTAAGTTPEACVDAYRGAYPKIAGSYAGAIAGRPYRSGGVWTQLERAAKSAIVEGGEHQAGKTVWDYRGGVLRCRLPSGRVLHYRDAAVEDQVPAYVKALGLPEKVKPTVVYAHPMGYRASLYGGKIAENCLTSDTLVVTLRGSIPITAVTADDMVWDGGEWVSTDGCIYKGEQEVGEWLGVRLTGDHLITDGKTWRPVTRSAGRFTRRALAWAAGSARWSLPFNGPVRTKRRGASVIAGGKVTSTPDACSGERSRVAPRAVIAARQQHGRPSPALRTSFPIHSCVPSGCIVTVGSCLGATIRNASRTRTMVAAGSGCIPSGGPTGSHSFGTPLPCRIGTDWTPTLTGWTTTGGMNPGTSGLQVGGLTPATAGTRAMSITGARGTHWPRSTPCAAPSGNRSTPSATTSMRVDRSKTCWRSMQKREPVFDLLNCGPRHRFTIVTDAGPVVVHNCVQAICRDLLASALVECERVGLPVVLHVHDELVCEVPMTDGPGSLAGPLADLARVMSRPPEWAAGFPVAVEGHAAPRYLKSAPAGWPKVEARGGEVVG